MEMVTTTTMMRMRMMDIKSTKASARHVSSPPSLDQPTAWSFMHNASPFIHTTMCIVHIPPLGNSLTLSPTMFRSVPYGYALPVHNPFESVIRPTPSAAANHHFTIPPFHHTKEGLPGLTSSSTSSTSPKESVTAGHACLSWTLPYHYTTLHSRTDKQTPRIH